MPKSLAQQSVRLGNPLISAKPHGADPAWAAWQAHVDHRNIGSGPGTAPEQMARHAHNERVLCGPRVPRIWET
ncbi:hypothetical protein N9D37_00240 [Erythrobacter sp.]|nr:hypothetical protein [Erythrobacter sp.]